MLLVGAMEKGRRGGILGLCGVIPSLLRYRGEGVGYWGIGGGVPSEGRG